MPDPEKKDQTAGGAEGKPAGAQGAEGGQPAPAGELSPELRHMADSYFERAAQATVRGNYDYALRLYLDGLKIDPREVEKGHKALHDCAVKRRGSGKGGGVGSLIGQMKGMFSQTLGRTKDAYLDLLETLSRNPQGVNLLMQMMQTARRLNLIDVAIYYGEVAAEETMRVRRPQKQIFTTLADMYESKQDFQKALDCLTLAIRTDPGDRTLDQRSKNLAAQVSIASSKLESVKGFHDIILDKAQAAKSATQQVIRTQEQLQAQFQELKAAWDADQSNPAKTLALADCHARLGNIDAAMQLLQAAFDRNREYRFKARMDDIRMAEFRRADRELTEQLAADPSRADLKAKRQQGRAERDAFELEVFTERQKQYPTDMNVRYELGVRQFRQGQHDDAIVSFQQATRDPKRRIPALNMLGRCFFAKKLFQEAQGQFETGIQQYEMATDPLGKELRYNLAMSFEAQGKFPQALEWYSVIVQQDYQYRDAAKHLEALRRKLAETESKS
ncbi:MAG: tetratricopeptide repeat protein [Planctomycetes bacterium]|nr:tetratricopeptide repeat protein [Planctomycetota bacterium]